MRTRAIRFVIIFIAYNVVLESSFLWFRFAGEAP